jgi:hypothetical protein
MENNLQPETIVSAARTRPFLRLAGFGFGLALFGAMLAARAVNAKPATIAETKRKAVVVELFTSEGCSSCPPADALLLQLRQQKQLDGTEVIPLGFHVDYWNDLGWQDRFSSSAYSRRQEQYARKFALDGPYTPQMVVDGSREFTGSDSSRARSAIVQEATQAQPADVQLSLPSPNKLLVRVTSSGGNNIAGDVTLAITEDNLTTNVAAGENNGRVLRHTAVVRDLRTLGRLSQGGFQIEAPLAPAKEWKIKDLHYVVFVQAPSSGQIEGAASLPAGR